jgi:hypothetical protein
MTSLCLTKHPVVKSYGRVKVQLHVFLSLAPDGGKWSVSSPGPPSLLSSFPGTHWIGGWVGSRTGLDEVARRKIPFPCREMNRGRSVRSPATILTELHQNSVPPVDVTASGFDFMISTAGKKWAPLPQGSSTGIPPPPHDYRGSRKQTRGQLLDSSTCYFKYPPPSFLVLFQNDKASSNICRVHRNKTLTQCLISSMTAGNIKEVDWCDFSGIYMSITSNADYPENSYLLIFIKII